MSVPYQALYELARELHRHKLNVRDIVHTALNRAIEIVGATQGGVVMFQDESTIQDAQITGTTPNSIELWETLLARGLIGYVYYDRRVVTIHNMQTDPRWPTLPKAPNMPQRGSAIGLPMVRGQGVSGVLLLVHAQVEYFDADKIALLEEITALTADAINNALDHRGDSLNRRYYTLFDNAVVPIILTNYDGLIIDINREAAALLGQWPNDLVNQPITAIHKVALDTLCDGEGLRGLRLDHETTARSTVRTANMGDLPVLVRLRHIIVDGHPVIEWIQQDISAQLALEQLRQDLTAMVYHDLRNPLQTVHASMTKLSQVLANHDEPAIWTLLQVGLRGSRQLRRMVDSLLDVQRLESGNTILDTQAVDLHDLLAGAVQLVQPMAIEAALRLKFDFGEALPAVNVDPDMINRVVVNLLENATKYTPSGGTITLIAYAEAEHVTIRVRDSGPGIPPEMCESIFDKYNRVNYKQAPKGIGLGLAFCRLAVTAHGGRIWVESELGNGSDFIFTLPHAQVKDRPASKHRSWATTA